MALKHWKAYSQARDAMQLRTHTPVAPLHILRADDKHLARLNLMRDILSRLHYAGKENKRVRPGPNVASGGGGGLADTLTPARQGTT